MVLVQIAESEGMVGKLRNISYLCASIKVDVYENHNRLDEIPLPHLG
jgi:hypothetical protein